METITIREAVREDCPRIMELIRQLAEFEKAPDEVTVSGEHFAQSGFGPDRVWRAVVAEADGGRICGFALWYVRYSTWKGRRLYLEDFYVEPDFRGRGIGKMLFDRVVREAREGGYNGMVWQVLDWNEGAIGFYRGYGANMDAGWINCSLDF